MDKPKKTQVTKEQFFNQLMNADLWAEQVWSKTGVNWWVFQKHCYEMLGILDEAEQKQIIQNLTRQTLSERIAQLRDKEQGGERKCLGKATK